jgi:hypothetical protein
MAMHLGMLDDQVLLYTWVLIQPVQAGGDISCRMRLRSTHPLPLESHPFTFSIALPRSTILAPPPSDSCQNNANTGTPPPPPGRASTTPPRPRPSYASVPCLMPFIFPFQVHCLHLFPRRSCPLAVVFKHRRTTIQGWARKLPS